MFYIEFYSDYEPLFPDQIAEAYWVDIDGLRLLTNGRAGYLIP